MDFKDSAIKSFVDFVNSAEKYEKGEGQTF